MEAIIFDYSKLNSYDKKAYDAMNEKEKTEYEKIWISIETQKAKLLQKQRASKQRQIREQKALNNKERKERFARLMFWAEALEANIEHFEEYAQEDANRIIKTVFSSKGVADYMNKQYSKFCEGSISTEFDN